jgi:polar amino acid transport system substrate-binding protein
VTALAVSALASAGCGSPTGAAKRAPDPVAAVPAAAAIAASVASTKCKDGKNQVASLAPDGIGISPSTWPSGSTMQKIRDRGYLIVGTSGDVELWGATDPKSGNLKGFDIDLLRAVADALDVEPDKTVYKVVNYGERLTSLEAGEVDLVAHTMTVNCDRWQGTGSAPNAINFSSEYYRAGQKLLVRTDSKVTRIQDLGGQSLCVPASSTNEALVQELNKSINPPVKVVALDVIGDCLVKFQEGEVVAITGDDTVLAGFVAQDDYARVVGSAISEEPYGLGIKASDTVFTRFVNAVLEKLRADGSLNRFYRETMGTAISGAAPAVPQPVYGRDVTKLGRP